MTNPTVPDPTDTTTDPRAERIAGIRAFADWLEAHPEVPAPNSVRAQHSIFSGSDTDRLGEFMRIARQPSLAAARLESWRGNFALYLTLGAVDYCVHMPPAVGTEPPPADEPAEPDAAAGAR